VSELTVSARARLGTVAWARFRSRRVRRLVDPVLSAAVLAAVVVAVREFVIAPLTGSFTGRFEDFEAYWDAATAANAGGDPYGTFDSGTVTMSGFIYPPLGALLLRPLALLDHHQAATLWLWIGLACTVAGSVIVARDLLPARWPRARIGLLAALTFPPATYNLWHGQANPVIFLLLALALRAWLRGAETRCGVLLGVAAAVKLAPFVLVALLWRRGWRRGSAALVVTAAGTSLLGAALVGAGALRTWLSIVLPGLSRDNGWVYNQTWGAVVSRLANHSVLRWEADSLPLHLAALTLSLSGVAAAAWAVSRDRRSSEVRGAEFAAGVTAMLLAGSVAWYAHYVHVLIPAMALVALAVRPTDHSPRDVHTPPEARHEGRRLEPAAVLVAGLAVLCVLAPVLIATTDMPTLISLSSGHWWWPYLQLWSLPSLAAAAMLAVLVRSIRAAGPVSPQPRRLTSPVERPVT